MVYLRRVSYTPPPWAHRFPFNLPIFHDFGGLEMLPITVFVGENGTGKSTLLEALAVKIDVQNLGERPLKRDPTLVYARQLAECLILTWNQKIHRGFFLRSEDFFAYLKQIETERYEHQEAVSRVGKEYQDHSRWAQITAATPARVALGQIQGQFGEDADGRSHGEGYLNIFRQRLHSKGIYLIDEAEAALSPISQLGLALLIRETAAAGAQFVIATHSPILMAIPGAIIYTFTSDTIHPIAYDEIDHVQFFRQFMAHPEAFFR